MPPRRPIDRTREAYRPGKARISQIINLKNVDFGVNRNNRYMKMSSGPSTSKLPNTSKTSVRSNSNSRHLAAFKNPLLNSYDFNGDEEYEPKHYNFDFYEGTSSSKAKAKKSKSKDNLRDNRMFTRTEDGDADFNLSFEEIRRQREREKKELEIIENARRLKEFEENERLEKQKRKERNARRERLKIEKEKRIKNRNGMLNTRQSTRQSTSQVRVDEKKVGKTVKMIEELLNESKKSKLLDERRESSDSENRYYDVVDLNKTKPNRTIQHSSRKSQLSTKSNYNSLNSRNNERGSSKIIHDKALSKNERERGLSKNERERGLFKNERERGSSNNVRERGSSNNVRDQVVTATRRDTDNYENLQRDNTESKKGIRTEKRARTRSKNKKPSEVTEQEKQEYFNERNIVVNQAIDDIDEYESSTVLKPRKINLQKEKSNFKRGQTVIQSRNTSRESKGSRDSRENNVIIASSSKLDRNSTGLNLKNGRYSSDNSQLSDRAYEDEREQYKETLLSRNNQSNSRASSDRESDLSVKERDNSKSRKFEPSAGKGLVKRSSSNNLNKTKVSKEKSLEKSLSEKKSGRQLENETKKEKAPGQFPEISTLQKEKSTLQNIKERVNTKNNIEEISDKNAGRTQIIRDYNPKTNDGTQTRKDSYPSSPSSPSFTGSLHSNSRNSLSPYSETDSSKEFDDFDDRRQLNKSNFSSNSEEESELKSSHEAENKSKKSSEKNNSEKKAFNKNLIQRLAHISEELSKDHLQFSPNAKIYVTTLIDDVQKIVAEVDREKDLYLKQVASTGASRDMTRNEMEKIRFDAKKSEREKTLINFNEKEIDYRTKHADSNKEYSNSLGLTMEGKNGIYIAIIKGTTSELDVDESMNSQKNKLRGEKEEQILLRKNYQNLEELITHTMGYDDYDSHYLKIAKLNRLKVLMEASMKIVGRPFNDISNEERTNLELEANRFHTTYPLPSEEVLLEETDDNGEISVRMPLKIVQEDGMAKIDINDNFIIDPSEFLTIYTTKLVNYAEETTGLKFNNMTLAIPATYGAAQREALKNSINDATDRDDVQILTRPVAAAVILNNQRNHDKDLASKAPFQNNSVSSYGSQSLSPEAFKLVFDMTEGSMDASVIRIKDSKDFHVISNVGDTSFGLHDLDERIVEYIINEKSKRKKRFKRNSDMESWSDHDLETVNAYANLIKHIKNDVEDVGAVSVDLLNMNESNQNSNKKKRKEDELYIDKKLISGKLCKDIYDWALAHIEKSILQADLNDKDIDEIVVIGGPNKMPGFREYLKDTYPYKRISFVKEEELAVGAAIVGRKLKYQQIKVTEVLCRSIGIGLYTGVITYLLFRNSSLPCIGGCVYSTLVDDQESMVLDIYEGERPHVKFCRYLGEVTVFDLPKGPAGSVKCEIYLKMDHEGLLEVTAKNLDSGATLETAIDANPEHLLSDEVNNDTELDPLEAERYKKLDYDLVYQLEKLDEHLDELSEKYFDHLYSQHILEKIFDTKEWLYNNRRVVSVDECHSIRVAIEKFLTNIENFED